MALTATPRRAFRLLYGAYAWFILVFAALPVAIACVLLPGHARRRRVARWGAATLFRLIGSPIRIVGKPLTPADVAVVVANHQSYLDGIILTAVLPPQYTFLIKGEMARVPVAGFVLERLGSEFVDRSSANHRHRSARRLVQAARGGRALAVFAEGTFEREPGLRPFHMGAFRAARGAGLPIAPIVIRGAREKLPADIWLPRPGPLTVEFCPVIPQQAASDERAMMGATRRAILDRLDEPDLDPPPAEASRDSRTSDRSPLPEAPSECSGTGP